MPFDALPPRLARLLRRLGQVGFLLCLVVLTVISLLPASVGDMEEETGIDDKIGHILGYGSVMGFGAFAAGSALQRVYLVVVLALYGGLMEVIQLLMAAGREASWADMAANGVGLAVGLLGALGIARLLQRHYTR